MLTLFPSGLGDLGCCHIPEAWAACFPRMDCHGADGAGGGVPANEPCPMDLVSLLPLRMVPQPPDPDKSSCSETIPTAPKGCGASGQEEL